MALVPFSYANPFTDQLRLPERLFTIDGKLIRIQQVRDYTGDIGQKQMVFNCLSRGITPAIGRDSTIIFSYFPKPVLDTSLLIFDKTVGSLKIFRNLEYFEPKRLSSLVTRD